MKNQYLCDIGDFGKYAPYQAFAKLPKKIQELEKWIRTHNDENKQNEQ